jgi:hypothetical protein
MPQTNAITMLRQLLASYINTASAANARGEFGTAKEWCGHALQRAPDLPEAWYWSATWGSFDRTSPTPAAHATC